MLRLASLSALYEAGAEYRLRLFGVEAQRILRWKRHLILARIPTRLSNAGAGGTAGVLRQADVFTAGRHSKKLKRAAALPLVAQLLDTERFLRGSQSGRSKRSPRHQCPLQPDPGEGRGLGLGASHKPSRASAPDPLERSDVPGWSRHPLTRRRRLRS